MFFERGEGPFIFDVDGNRYIDYVLGQGPAILGHSPRRVLERVEQALKRGQLFAGQYDLEISVSEMIQKLVPCAELVRYSNSGSEIVQAALSLGAVGISSNSQSSKDADCNALSTNTAPMIPP